MDDTTGKKIRINKRKKNKEQKKGKLVVILVDSMVKHLNCWEARKDKKNCRAYVRSFPIAKLKCVDNLIPIQTLISSSNFIKIPIPILLESSICFKDQSCDFEKS